MLNYRYLRRDVSELLISERLCRERSEGSQIGQREGKGIVPDDPLLSCAEYTRSTPECGFCVWNGEEMTLFWRRYINFCRTSIFLGGCAGIAAVIAKIRIPILIGSLIDFGIVDKDSGRLLVTIVSIVLYGLAGSFLWLLCKLLFQNAGYRVGKQIRWDLYQAMQDNSVVRVEQMGSEALGERMAEDTDLIEGFLQNNVPQIGYLIVSMAGSAAAVFRIHTGMGTLFLLLIFLFVLCIAGMLCSESERRQMIWRNVCGMLAALSFPCCFCFALVWGGRGEMTIGQIGAFFFYLYPFRKTAPFVFLLRRQHDAAQAAFVRVMEAMNLSDMIQEGKIPFSTHSEINTPQILFDDVSLQREGEDALLRHFSLEITSGECVGIVAQKEEAAAISNLLVRFEDPTDGQVKMDGLSVREYTFADLRSQIGMVRKQDRMRCGTIRDNLLAGNADASEEDLQKVICAVGLEEWIGQLPSGLSTPVWKKEENLAQQHLLCIARMLVKEPAILVLQEVWDEISFEWRRDIIQGIRKAYPYLTILLIDSWEENVEGADRIIRKEEEDGRWPRETMHQT